MFCLNITIFIKCSCNDEKHELKSENDIKEYINIYLSNNNFEIEKQKFKFPVSSIAKSLLSSDTINILVIKWEIIYF